MKHPSVCWSGLTKGGDLLGDDVKGDICPKKPDDSKPGSVASLRRGTFSFWLQKIKKIFKCSRYIHLHKYNLFLNT